MDLRTIPESEIFEGVRSDENRAHVLGVFSQLATDPIYTSEVTTQIRNREIEIRGIASWIAKSIEADRYMEVGVRRGFSMAMVASRRPDAEIWGFDAWVSDYANVPNPGPDFVRAELAKCGYRGRCEFVNGWSHQTLPPFVAGKPAPFDIVTVDGDHTMVGARIDLEHTFQLVRSGGALLFDDLDSCSLAPLWDEYKKLLADFWRFVEYRANLPGVGIAIRR